MVKRAKVSEDVEKPVSKVKINNRLANGTFSRVDPTAAEALPEAFKDNSFHAKARFGNGGDDFGISSNDRLDPTKGKSFWKEKTKLKNKNFFGMGNRIGYQVNSIKF